MKMEIKLYDEFTEKELKKVVKFLDPSKDKIEIVESTVANMSGEYCIIEGYMFKQCCGGFQCLKTPEESHEYRTMNTTKAKGDRGKDYFTRYRTSNGGKDEFNPVSNTGGREDIAVTKKRLNI